MSIAVWYHCKISGVGIPSPAYAETVVAEQMDALTKSGLSDAATEIHIGINGNHDDAMKIASHAPDKATLYVHGSDSRSELPTFALLREWLPSHSKWKVLYHHSKGVTRDNDPEKNNHRLVMQKAVVDNWRTCVRDLDRGYQAVGINLVDPITRPVLRGRFFAGNFWWARADYLLSLPEIPDSVVQYTDRERCVAEMWIGRSKVRPAMLDYERPELSQWCIRTGKVRAL